MLRTCAQCSLELPPARFRTISLAKGKRSKTCKDCERAYFQEHYAKNRAAYIDRAKAHNRKTVSEQRASIAELRNQPCADCGGIFPPYVMEFDHRSGVEKKTNIADMPKRYYSKRLLAAELAKCDLVCANCHRARTHHRGTRRRTTPEITA